MHLHSGSYIVWIEGYTPAKNPLNYRLSGNKIEKNTKGCDYLHKAVYESNCFSSDFFSGIPNYLMVCHEKEIPTVYIL